MTAKPSYAAAMGRTIPFTMNMVGVLDATRKRIAASIESIGICSAVTAIPLPMISSSMAGPAIGARGVAGPLVRMADPTPITGTAITIVMAAILIMIPTAMTIHMTALAAAAPAGVMIAMAGIVTGTATMIAARAVTATVIGMVTVIEIATGIVMTIEGLLRPAPASRR